MGPVIVQSCKINALNLASSPQQPAVFAGGVGGGGGLGVENGSDDILISAWDDKHGSSRKMTKIRFKLFTSGVVSPCVQVRYNHLLYLYLMEWKYSRSHNPAQQQLTYEENSHLEKT